MTGRDGYSLQFHTIYIYGTHATLVGSGETAHDSERILHKRFVLQGVLHISIPLSVTIELTVITAIRRIGGIAGFMSCLTLLLTSSHVVDGACNQCGSGCISLTHIAFFISLSGLRIPIATVASMLNLIEWHERQLVPIALALRALSIDGECQVAHLLDALEQIAAITNEKRCTTQ